MPDYGIKVSRPGYDAKTATPVQLVYSSKYDELKVFASGSGSKTVTPGTVFTPNNDIVQITHDLGYKPAFFCFCDNPLWVTANRFSPYTYKGVGANYNQPSFSVDTTKLYLTFWNPDTANNVTFNYRYHIYYNILA